MSRDITEQIDDICNSEYGHTNWAFADTLSEKELKEIKDKELGIKLPSIVFYMKNMREWIMTRFVIINLVILIG